MNTIETKLISSKLEKNTIIPDSWKVTKLGHVATLTDGNWILKEDYSVSGIRLLQIGDIGIAKFLDKSSKYVSENRVKELNCNVIDQTKDILISRMPDPVGRACISPSLPYPYIVAVDISILKPKNNIIDSSFLLLTLNSHQNFSNVLRYVSGSTRQRISRKNLEEIEILLPPKKEQEQIARILGSVDSTIEHLQQSIDLTQTIKKSMIKNLFTKGVDHKKFKTINWFFGKQIKIPDNWDVKSCAEISTKILDGEHNSPPFSDHGIPYISSQHVKSKISFKDCKYVSSDVYKKLIERCNPEFNDILITVKGTIGHCKRIDIKEDFCMDRNVGLIKPKPEQINSIYLEQILSSDIVQNQILFLLDSNVIPSLYLHRIKSIKLILPPLQEQEQITSIISKINSKINFLESKKIIYTKIKQGMTQKLLSGKLRAVS